MSVKTNDILEQLKSLTQFETTELVKQIESTFQVDASLIDIIGIPADLPPVKPPEAPEQTEFDVVLEEVPVEKKIATLLVVRSLTGLGLKEAKTFVESVPKVVKEAIAKEAALDVKVQLEAVGAKVALK